MAPSLSKLTDLAEKLVPEIGQNSIEVDTRNGIRIHFNGRRNPVSDSINAFRTLSDNPGNHKKKGLLGLGVTAAGAGGAMYAATRPGVMGALNRTSPGSLALTLLSVAGPALAYYATRNKNIAKKAIPAAVGSLGATAASNYLSPSPTGFLGICAPSMAASAGLTAGAGATVGGIAYATDHFQQAEDLEHIKAIQEDPKLSPSQRKAMIEEIKSGRSMLQKYPITRYAPWADRLNNAYGSAHGYNGASDFMRVKIRE